MKKKKVYVITTTAGISPELIKAGCVKIISAHATLKSAHKKLVDFSEKNLGRAEAGIRIFFD